MIVDLHHGVGTFPRQQTHHQLPSNQHVSLEALSLRTEVASSSLVLGRLFVVLKVGQDHLEWPVDLVDADGAQSPGFLVGVQEVDEEDELEDDLCYLEVVDNHVVFYHLFEGSVVEIEDEVESVLLNLLLEGHPSWHLPLLVQETALLDS